MKSKSIDLKIELKADYVDDLIYVGDITKIYNFNFNLIRNIFISAHPIAKIVFSVIGSKGQIIHFTMHIH